MCFVYLLRAMEKLLYTRTSLIIILDELYIKDNMLVSSSNSGNGKLRRILRIEDLQYKRNEVLRCDNFLSLPNKLFYY